MGRRYLVPLDAVTVAMGTDTDLAQIVGASLKMLRILEVGFFPTGGTTLPTSATFNVRGRVLPPTVTRSGGTSVTPQKIDPGDAAATFTSFVNNTTKATTNGTAQIVLEGGAHVYAGFSYQFPSPPVVPPTSAFVFELLGGLVQSLVCNGSVLVEEIG